MKMILQKSPQTALSTLVLFFARDKKAGKPVGGKLSAAAQSLVDGAINDVGFAGDKKESVLFRNAGVDGYQNILLVGLGDSQKVDAECLRVAASIAYSGLKASKVSSAGFAADGLLRFVKDTGVAVEAIAQGVELTAYDFTDLKTKPESKKKDERPKLQQISLLLSAAPSAAQQKALQRGEILSECQNFVRWLGDNPSNYMTPTILANDTAKAAKGTGLKVTIWDKARIQKEKFGGLLAVSQGAYEEPRFIVMEYKGAPASKKPVCFVGKGVTFDTGGISIKPGAGMEEMKYDMCGGAAVIGTLLALAKLKAKVNVIGLVPACENMPGSRAFKPGDVYVARNGKTVEVFNTDAEGRLILGDALAYASEQKPAVIFDAATLTGAILIALGNTHTGVFTRDTKLRKTIQAASDVTGELVWAMPLVDAHVDDMKGTHADLANISGGRLAGSSTAAAFLEQFVAADIPWAHFDIAGTAWNVSSRLPYCPKKSASGAIMRTFVQLAESY
jgi:leucyl aminopeptidase